MEIQRAQPAESDRKLLKDATGAQFGFWVPNCQIPPSDFFIIIIIIILLVPQPDLEAESPTLRTDHVHPSLTDLTFLGGSGRRSLLAFLGLGPSAVTSSCRAQV